MTETPTSGNLLADLLVPAEGEFFEDLLSRPGVRIERIVSNGHVSPEGVWFDQDQDEWVTVAEGAADLEIEGEPEARRLERGDWVFLPAHCRHRVVWTADDGPTVWLAVHYVKN